MHMVEAVRGDSFILLQSNSPFAYQACCLWEGGEDYVSQKWGCANLIVFVEETLEAGGLMVNGNRRARLLSNPGRSPLLSARVTCVIGGASVHGTVIPAPGARSSNRSKRSSPAPSATFFHPS